MTVRGSSRPFVAELSRRRVLHVLFAYASAGIAVALATEALYDDLLLPDWTPRLVIVLLIAGLPIAVGLAWSYRLVPDEEAAQTREPDTSLREMSAAPFATDRPGIVVLPFDNLSPDPGDAWFSDGLTEELIADLSTLESLRVISRTSAMKLKGTDRHVREIGALLNVEYVLEGSVRKAGDKLRITAQLIDARRDEHVWSEKYDGVLADVFEVQERFSREIVKKLRGKLTPSDVERIDAPRPPADFAVHEAYARARYEFWRTDPGSQKRALHLLEDAVKRLGRHPLLLSGIGALHWQFRHQLGDTDPIHIEEIARCADELFAADPDSSHGHRLRSYLRLMDGRTEEALRHLLSAVTRDANDTETLLWLGYMLAFHAGRPALAKPYSQRWYAIDPLNPISCAGLMVVHWMEGDLDAALRSVDHLDELDPGNRLAGFYRSHLLAWQGRLEEANRESERIVMEDPGEPIGQTARFLVLGLLGRHEEARGMFTPPAMEVCWGDFHLPWIVAETQAAIGDTNEALRWLERAVERGLFNYPLLARDDPFLAPLRDEPRFVGLLDRVRKRWEDFGRHLEGGFPRTGAASVEPAPTPEV